MFSNIFINRIKSSIRAKDMIFWTWIFPILIATLFSFALGDIDKAEQLDIINVAVVDNNAYRQNEYFNKALDEVSKSGDNQLFSLTYVSSASQADTLLENGDIDGYIIVDKQPELIVKENGLNQTIMKNFLDSYQQTYSSIMNIASNNPQALNHISVNSVNEIESFTEEISLSSNKPSATVTYFYALLAMVCLYGAFQGLSSVLHMQSNLSSVGIRNSLAPINKLRIVLYDLFGGFTVHLVCLFIVLGYIIFVLGIDFGNKALFIVLTCIIGSIVGVAMGALITAATKWSEIVKTAIIICISMVFCFMAGLMISGINYIIAQNIPILAWINPAALISDAFYCLYFYDDLNRYFLDIGVLIIMAVVMLLGTAILLRRQKYESI